MQPAQAMSEKARNNAVVEQLRTRIEQAYVETTQSIKDIAPLITSSDNVDVDDRQDVAVDGTIEKNTNATSDAEESVTVVETVNQVHPTSVSTQQSEAAMAMPVVVASNTERREIAEEIEKVTDGDEGLNGTEVVKAEDGKKSGVVLASATTNSPVGNFSGKSEVSEHFDVVRQVVTVVVVIIGLLTVGWMMTVIVRNWY